MRNRIVGFATLSLIALLTACTAEPSEPIGGTELPGHLVVSQGDASIFTIRPDGSDRYELVTPESGLVAVQPTWSADGSSLVWTEVDHMSEVPEAFIVSSGPQGQRFERVSVSAAPFYYFWSPTGDHVAFLASGPGGTVDLALLNDGIRSLGEASPYYFAWAPDGRTLLTHTDVATVAFLNLDGTSTTLKETRARFQAPQWASDGTHLVYATGFPPPTGGIRTAAFQADQEEIVIADPDGGILHRIGPFSGVATFELSPDGRQIAHSVTFDRDAFNFGPLVVTELKSGKDKTVSSEPVLAYQWSPTGDLLYLVAEEGIDHPSFRWVVWDGRTTTEYSLVTPTPIFAASYLPFWDQYSRSHTLWSPDGTAFVYAGPDGDGEPAIWVQILDTDTGPLRVASGDIAFWSPAAR